MLDSTTYLEFGGACSTGSQAAGRIVRRSEARGKAGGCFEAFFRSENLVVVAAQLACTDVPAAADAVVPLQFPVNR